MNQDESALLNELVSRQQIQEVVTRYCRGIDRSDADIINSAYHADAQAVYQHFTAVGSEIGRKLIDLVENVSPRRASMHTITNHLCHIDGNVARSETYFISWSVSKSDSPTILIQRGGRYLDELERRDGVWLIASRTVVWDWGCKTEMPPGGYLEPTGLKGLRTREDESYKFVPASELGAER